MKINFGHFVDSGESYVRIASPAKLNLFLEVLGKRDDGYHEIETLMCPITLFDHLLVETTQDGSIQFELILPESAVFRKSGQNDSDPAWKIPDDQENLVVKAANSLRELLGVQEGVRIRLDKQIPAAAGLGGGSSNAAAVIVACLKLWERWDRQIALQVSHQLGSDIAFFLGDTQRIGLALASGRGEQCETLSVAPNLRFLVMHPPSGCSTPQVYQGVTIPERARKPLKIKEACKDGQSHQIGTELFNALQFPAKELNPWIEKQLQLAHEFDFEFALMSGSGSSCFVLLSEKEEVKSSKKLKEFIREAKHQGIERVYEAEAWYAPSIEQQLNIE